MPVNLRTTRPPSLSSIRQCRKSGSEGSSVFNEKSTENVSPDLEKVIFPIPTESDFLPRRLLWSLPCAYCLRWYLRSSSSGLILSSVYRCGSGRTCCLSPQLQQIRFQPFGLGSGEPLEHEAALVFNSVAPILGIRNTKCCITEHAVSLSLSNPQGSGTPRVSSVAIITNNCPRCERLVRRTRPDILGYLKSPSTQRQTGQRKELGDP